MVEIPNFKPEHMNVAHEDLCGNNGIGRYIFFPGSDGRARKIAEIYFKDLKIKKHDRKHNLYTGYLEADGLKIDVASISSGMGTPSLDIIFNELVRLGAKRFLRVGTSGLLQPSYMKGGDLVIGTAAIRDEGASNRYLPSEYPAVGSIDFVVAAEKAAKKLGVYDYTHIGIIHSKDSLYAREFGEGPQAEQNKKYMDILRGAGAVASEMEASMLYVLTELFDHKMRLKYKDRHEPQHYIKSGVVCVVLGEGTDYGNEQTLKKMTDDINNLSIQTVIEMAKSEMQS